MHHGNPDISGNYGSCRSNRIIPNVLRRKFYRWTTESIRQ